MKRWFPILICAILFSVNLYAQNQEKPSPKNEIGTHILSYSTYPFHDKYGRIVIDNAEQKPFQFLKGISYKRHINQHIIRTSFTYRNLKNDIYSKRRTGNYDEYILKCGYERDLTKTKLTPYLAADVGFFYVAYKGSTSYENTLNIYNLKGFGAGISPAFGLKYKLSQHLSLNAESCLDLVYLRFNHTETTHTITYYPYTDENFKTYNFDLKFNPLQKLSLNVQF